MGALFISVIIENVVNKVIPVMVTLIVEYLLFEPKKKVATESVSFWKKVYRCAIVYVFVILLLKLTIIIFNQNKPHKVFISFGSYNKLSNIYQDAENLRKKGLNKELYYIVRKENGQTIMNIGILYYGRFGSARSKIDNLKNQYNFIIKENIEIWAIDNFESVHKISKTPVH